MRFVIFFSKQNFPMLQFTFKIFFLLLPFKVVFPILFNKEPKYDHLKAFGCLRFPNINHSSLDKLSPRSTPYLFLGYLSHHRGYRCLDLKTNKIIISRHVIFNESIFPAADKHSSTLKYNFRDITDFNSSGLFLSQEAYAEDIIKRAGMRDYKPCATLVDLKSKLSAKIGELISDPTGYRSLAGALQYLTFTRPDISYDAIKYVSSCMLHANHISMP